VATKKQQRRRQKLKRHEYEEVYVDDEGRELDPEEAEELVASRPTNGKAAKAKREQPAQRGGRTIDPPSWRRTLRRGLIFAPLMFLTVMLLGQDLSLAQQVGQTVVLMGFFLPFSYFMDSMMFRSYQRRLAKQADAAKKR
jgi:hypothetical protein